MAEYDPTDVHEQDRARKQRELREKLERDKVAGDTKWLMSSARGRRIVWRLFQQAGVFRSSFNTNAMAMAFAEGNRNVGLALVDDIHRTCPELYTVMLGENAPKEQVSDD